jgi:NAD(P)-dependent dehydrogenase (short-subunit alcohol dehydrogenase family)
MASVLITGTSKGIGLETALAFGRAGYRVYATMRNPSLAPELAETAAREKLSIAVSIMDVDSDQSVRDGIARIQREHGSIDVLINNAGVERIGSVEELALADFRAAMETNYFGALRCIQALVPEMRKRCSGTIVNVTSVAGRLANPPMAAYNASKWALEALSEALAIEMKPFNVRVAIVEPGIIDTAMARRITNEPDASPYPHRARFAALFANSFRNPVPASLVAEKIVGIVKAGSWQLRYPTGPDAQPLLARRNGMTDEQWIELNATDDETWYRNMGLELPAERTA